MELLMDSIENQVNDTDKRLSVHEAVCAERYEGIQESFSKVEESFEKGVKRMQKIEYMLYIVIASILFGKDVVFNLFEKMIGK